MKLIKVNSAPLYVRGIVFKEWKDLNKSANVFYISTKLYESANGYLGVYKLFELKRPVKKSPYSQAGFNCKFWSTLYHKGDKSAVTEFNGAAFYLNEEKISSLWGGNFKYTDFRVYEGVL